MIGLSVVDGAFELVCGDAAVGRRRHLDAAAVVALEECKRHGPSTVNVLAGV